MIVFQEQAGVGGYGYGKQGDAQFLINAPHQICSGAQGGGLQESCKDKNRCVKA